MNLLQFLNHQAGGNQRFHIDKRVEGWRIKPRSFTHYLNNDTVIKTLQGIDGIKSAKLEKCSLWSLDDEAVIVRTTIRPKEIEIHIKHKKMVSIGNDIMATNEWIRVHQEATHFREVKMDLVDGMDNQYRMTFKKDERGDFKLFCHGQAFSNFQILCGIDDLEWIADDGDWKAVVDRINSGVKTVTGIKAR